MGGTSRRKALHSPWKDSSFVRYVGGWSCQMELVVRDSITKQIGRVAYLR